MSAILLILLIVVQAGYINCGEYATTDKWRSLGGVKQVFRIMMLDWVRVWVC